MKIDDLILSSIKVTLFHLRPKVPDIITQFLHYITFHLRIQKTFRSCYHIIVEILGHANDFFNKSISN